MPTSIAYAIWSGVGMVLIAAVAWAFQGQRLEAAALVDWAMIVGGVVVMNLFSASVSH